MRLLGRLHIVILALWLPGVAIACDYPAPLRTISATLMSIQDTSGQVAPFHRARLRQALRHLDLPALQRDLAAALNRADRRAATQMLTLSATLANGIGRDLSERQAAQARHLANAIRVACPADTLAKAQGIPRDASREQSAPHLGDATGTGITFREGLTRLSLTFTIYAVFLAVVIGLRRQWKVMARSVDPDPAPPANAQPIDPRNINQLPGV